MYLRDKLGSFEIIVDRERRVVHEKLSGLFTANDSCRMEKEYMNNVIPFLGAGKWMKLCDMSEYILNSSADYKVINHYVKNLIPYGFVGCAIVLNNKMVQDVLSLSVQGIDTISFRYFKSEQEADKYLRDLGF